MISFQTISPEKYKTDHGTFKIYYGFYDTPFGRCSIAVTDTNKAILHFGFVVKDDISAVEDLQSKWLLSEIAEDSDQIISTLMEDIFSPNKTDKAKPILVLLKGTEFQIEVWKALVAIQEGTTVTYQHVAYGINKPKAIRAVANAIAKNPIAYLIPCHRVVGKNGSNKYSWGVEYKLAILSYETNKSLQAA